MNPSDVNDPGLQSLEARLTGLAPRLSAIEKHQILYRCAFVAGVQATSKMAWRWRVVSATLGVLACGLAIPLLLRGPSPEMEVQRDSPVVTKSAVEQDQATELNSQEIKVSVDAWQTQPESSSTILDRELARYRQLDPDLKTHSLATLTQAMGSQL